MAGKHKHKLSLCIRDSVVERFIGSGETSTIEMIASDVGCSVSTVRKVVAIEFGNVEGTLVSRSCDRKHRFTADPAYLALMIRDIRSGAGVRFEFGKRKTAKGCVAWMRSPKRVVEKVFRNGYSSADLSADKWIESELASIDEWVTVEGVTKPVVVVHGKTVR